LFKSLDISLLALLGCSLLLGCTALFKVILIIKEKTGAKTLHILSQATDCDYITLETKSIAASRPLLVTEY
jgi:hypothetical protein